MNEKDLRWDDHYNFRVVKSEDKFYLQREFTVTGYEDDGTYNPCISSVWNTLSILDNYQFSYIFQSYRGFDSIKELLVYWKNAPENQILNSSVYSSEEDEGRLPQFRIIQNKQEVMGKYPEVLV